MRPLHQPDSPDVLAVLTGSLSSPGLEPGPPVAWCSAQESDLHYALIWGHLPAYKAGVLPLDERSESWREWSESNAHHLVWRQVDCHCPTLPKLSFNCQRAQNKKPAFWGGSLNPDCVGFYPPPPRPVFIAIVAHGSCCGVQTQMPHLSKWVPGLGNLNIFRSGAGYWISTSDTLLTGQVP